MWRRRHPRPDVDMDAAEWEADRAIADARTLGRGADDLLRRADAVGERWRQTREVNHVAEAVVESIRRRARHS